MCTGTVRVTILLCKDDNRNYTCPLKRTVHMLFHKKIFSFFFSVLLCGFMTFTAWVQRSTHLEEVNRSAREFRGTIQIATSSVIWTIPWIPIPVRHIATWILITFSSRPPQTASVYPIQKAIIPWQLPNGCVSVMRYVVNTRLLSSKDPGSIDYLDFVLVGGNGRESPGGCAVLWRHLATNGHSSCTKAFVFGAESSEGHHVACRDLILRGGWLLPLEMSKLVRS